MNSECEGNSERNCECEVNFEKWVAGRDFGLGRRTVARGASFTLANLKQADRQRRLTRPIKSKHNAILHNSRN